MLATCIAIGAVALLIPTFSLLAEVLLAASYRPEPRDPDSGRPTVAVIVPAHNEETVIVDTLRSIFAQVRETDRVLVIADNCSDATAACAARLGAEVATRADPSRRGKGYALDFGLRQLEANPPDVVIVIDADCQIAAGALDHLAAMCAATGQPAQALYLMRASASADAIAKIAQFAWTVRNKVRPLGLLRLGAPCPLFGTGMAFPWTVIRTADIAHGHIVEDLKLGISLARAGSPACFCPEAVVIGEFAATGKGTRSQRTRWEHGHLSLIASDALPLFLHGVVKSDPGLIALALDLSVPPLALLMLLLVTVWASATEIGIHLGTWLPFGVAACDFVMFAAAVGLSWIRFGRNVLSLGDLALAALYALSKVPLYVRFLVARQVEWVRSSRRDERR